MNSPALAVQRYKIMSSTLTVQQAADRAKMPHTTLRHHISKGHLRTHRFGSQIAILEHDLEQFIADHKAGRYPRGFKR
jgi:excisionase family DNA binding protein